MNASQIHDWKKQLLAGAPELFSDKRRREIEDDEGEKARLYEEIGRLKVELDWLKKNPASSSGIEERLDKPISEV